jgi:hypothetical protein
MVSLSIESQHQRLASRSDQFLHKLFGGFHFNDASTVGRLDRWRALRGLIEPLSR